MQQMKQSQPRLDRVLSPFRAFAQKESSGGILLLISTVIALVWANSRWGDSYSAFWHLHLSVHLGDFSLSESLHGWINDGLMAMFFFVVGLELKREMIAGELSSRRHAAFPFAAALGGMVVPALIYTLLNAQTVGARGWGIPMATDIAFALAILSLIPRGVPLTLKIFLTALAIADDLGAVLVIAIFYSSDISLENLAIGAVLLTVLIAANALGVRHPLVYAFFGGGVWLAFLFSGVHATVAGVLVAMTIPARSRINSAEFVARTKEVIDEFDRLDDDEVPGESVLGRKRLAGLFELKSAYESCATPLQLLETALHPWVVFFILPLFALANAGVELGSGSSGLITNPITLGVVLGLIVGKQIGITSFAWLAVRLGLAALPAGVTWRQIYGISCLGGIGFTMSIFIATLAFESASLLVAAKTGILLASLLSAVIGWVVVQLSMAKERVSSNEVD